MITLSKFKSFLIENKYRIAKVLQYGVKTAKTASAFGDDSSPLKDMIAVFAETSESGESVIIGYLNKNQIAKAGEKRIFSLKENGDLSTAIHLKNDETIEIGGDSDNMVRFSYLDAGLQNQASLINAELAKIATGISLAGGSYTPQNIVLDISAAKNDNIKIS